MLVSLFSKGYRVILFTSLFDLFLFYAKIETICKADTEKVIETTGDMSELSFLSRTEILEIEKE